MKRLLIIFIVLLIIFTGLFLLGENLGWFDPQYIEQFFSRFSGTFAGQIWTASAIVGLLGVDLILPIPSSLVMVLSGKLLGFLTGGITSFAGAMLAAIIGYFACYWGGTRIFTRLIKDKEADKVVAWFEKYGIYAIILSRPIPMLTEILSCTAGLYRFPFRLFLAASILGTLPICFVYSYFGNLGSVTNPWPLVWVSVIVPAIGWLITYFIKGKILATS
jgi:uncharacterized membrane protein YdjX (TVP38/TMEM64 family)